jgi:hypothetical protein
VRALLTVLASLIVGCMPWPTLVQPGIALHVVNREGSPVEGATVRLARYSVSFLPEEHVESRVTDASGRASFSSQRKWQVFIAAPEGGGTLYSWSWCVEAPGYAPALANDLRSEGYSSSTAATLESGAGRCEWHCYPCAYSFVAE